MAAHSLALLVPSRARHRALRRCLRCNALGDDQTLVCDQSPTPFADPGPWRILHRPELPGLTAARNLLLRSTTATVVVFIDDDVVLAPAFFDCLRRLVAAEPGIAAWGPVVETRGLWTRRMHRLSQLGAMRDPRRLTTSPADLPTRALFGCCFAVRRAAALAVGGFDQRFTGYGLGEDLDFFLRLHRAGYRARFCRDLACHHHQEPAGRDDRYRRGLGKGRLLRHLARRHGHDNPATVLHLGLAAVAAMSGYGREPADIHAVLHGLTNGPSREANPDSN